MAAKSEDAPKPTVVQLAIAPYSGQCFVLMSDGAMFERMPDPHQFASVPSFIWKKVKGPLEE